MMVYLICFDQPYKRVRHYTGMTDDLAARMKEHRRGRGARLLEVVSGAGIGWQLVAVWKGGRREERACKNLKNAGLICPRCRAEVLRRRAETARARYHRRARALATEERREAA